MRKYYSTKWNPKWCYNRKIHKEKDIQKILRLPLGMCNNDQVFAEFKYYGGFEYFGSYENWAYGWEVRILPSNESNHYTYSSLKKQEIGTAKFVSPTFPEIKFSSGCLICACEVVMDKLNKHLKKQGFIVHES